MLRRHPWLTLLAVRLGVVVVVLVAVEVLAPGADFLLGALVALGASALVGALVEKRLGIDAASRRAAAEGAEGARRATPDGGTPPPGGPGGGAGGR
ncbi:hypothetical protein WDV85_10985 [Pseudokineococcus sp. 5B2Z-1]|uniref:hypothetical protein n=1 Tax=Pseudokineococcus sp. 5B2Z-1 TaxID=3132744 RepID=UPI0030B57909